MQRPDDLVDELADYFDFLKDHDPFSDLSPEQLADTVRNLEVAYFRGGEEIFRIGDHVDGLYIVRKGAVEVSEEEGLLIAREGEGECFGFPALLTDGVARREARAVEDTLVYLVKKEAFNGLRSANPRVERFYAAAHEGRLRSVVQEQSGNRVGLLAQSLRSLVTPKTVFLTGEATVQEAAQKMAAQQVGSVLIGAPDGLEGILTDRDLRNRVLAKGLDGSVQIKDVMTPRPVTLDIDSRVLEALLTMTRYRVHHLPAVDDGVVVGVMSATDVLRAQANHPVYLVGEIKKQSNLAGLVEVSKKLPVTVERLARANGRASDIGQVVTLVADAITERLIEFAEAELGPAPGRYAWVGLGSQARGELGMSSDQDNGLILEDGLEVHDEWFQKMASRVTHGLDACGFPTCPGDVMATNQQWRRPASEWKRYFADWIETPDPKALLHASVFFDLRTVSGDDDLVSEIRDAMLERAKPNQRFLASLARAALEHRPPLGFFRQFVLDAGGEEGKALDLKHRGVAPIISLARVYALSVGSPEVGTRARIEDAEKRGGLTSDDSASLLDAHAYISELRLEHQAQQIRRGVKPDNYVSPDSLSGFERTHLKDAFKVVATLQSGIEYRFKTGMLG